MTQVLSPQDVIPLFCKECHIERAYVRDPKNDIASESGKTMWSRWRCKCCGHSVIYPAVTSGGGKK